MGIILVGNNFNFSCFSRTIHALINIFSFIKARFHCRRGMEHFLFLLLIFPRLKPKQAQNEPKKVNKTKNTPFHARSGNKLSTIGFTVFTLLASKAFYRVEPDKTI